jgi:benzylsuccinate CoA-transferase BbsE subunit
MREIEKPQKVELLLEPYRVLDLTDAKGLLCGKILADLGADVIKIERPGGDPARNIGPFYHGIPHPEKSLFWFAYNANKKSITLNIESTDGQELLKKLVAKTNIVLESFTPGYMESLGLSYEKLTSVNRQLIMVSISAFGQTGPYKDYKASDIVLVAMGGSMYLYGDSDRPPVRISFPQAYLHASADAAVASVIALYYQQVIGEGQHVDVSAQESGLALMFNALPFWDMNKIIQKRVGGLRAGLTLSDVKLSQTWPCKDGSVTFLIMGGRAGQKTNKALVEWMESEGMANDFLRNIDWNTYDFATATQEFHDRIHKPIAQFFTSHTKQELFEEAVKRGVMLYPVNTAKEILENPQLKERGFWQDVYHPELDDTITYVGTLMEASEVSMRIRRRAPLIGEHNTEIYEGELGLSRKESIALKQAGVI